MSNSAIMSKTFPDYMKKNAEICPLLKKKDDMNKLITDMLVFYQFFQRYLK